MSRDHLGPSSDQDAAEEPRGAQTPARLRVPGRLARPARAVAVAALGLLLLSIVGNQQPPQAIAVAATTTDQAVGQVVESPAASVEVATATPVASSAATPVELEVASVAVETAPVEVVALATEEPAASQDEMLRDLGPQLSARGGRASEVALLDEQVGLAPEPATQEMSASVAVQANPATPRLLSTKAPAASPAKTPKPASQKPAPPRTVAPASSLGQRAVSIALRYIGYRYRFGGISPSTGFDCSGFVYFVYKAAGHPISRDIYAQYRTGAPVSRSSLRPGDLVFFKNTYKAGLSHASIYVGGGRIVHAQSESTGVTITSLSTAYWSSRYLGARRP